MKPMYLHRSNSGQPPKIKRGYEAKFKTTPAYRASMPDMMEAAHDAIQGAHVPIQQVGIHNFKLPLKYRTKGGKTLTLETSQCHRHGFPRGRAEGHQHEPHHAVVL